MRIARRPDGAVVVDSSGHTPGRGAYVCSEQACFDLAAKRGRLERALRVRVGTVDLEQLKRELV